jgi:hypothetical protein
MKMLTASSLFIVAIAAPVWAQNPLTISADANATYTKSYVWSISKSADKARVKQVGGTAIFAYLVNVSHDNGTNRDVFIRGAIRVFNRNVDVAGKAIPVNISGVTDVLSNGVNCVVYNGGPQTLTEPETDFSYECALTVLPEAKTVNLASVYWPAQKLANGALLLQANTQFRLANFLFRPTSVDDCVSLADNFDSEATHPFVPLCVGGPNPAIYQYSRSIAVPDFNCASYPDTASFVTNTSRTSGSSTQKVTVCGPEQTGALPVAFWEGDKGQTIISSEGVCPSGVWLRQFAPFQDLSEVANCVGVGIYVGNIMKTANAVDAPISAKEKAQMLASALNVYFSDARLGGNKIQAPAPIGSDLIDLSQICKDSGCKAYEDTRPEFDVSTEQNTQTVLEMLNHAGAHSDPGGTTWYDNDPPMQDLAKDAFDVLNNQKIFGP